MGPLVFFGTPGSSVLTVVLFWTITYAWGGSELFLGWRLARRKQKDVVDRDAGSKWVLIASIWLGVAAGIALAAAVPQLAIRSDREVLFAAGIALALVGIGLRFYSVWFLGLSFTCEVATVAGQSVVDRGPYRWLRHPSYSGGLLTVFGLLLCLTNWLSFAGFLIAVAGYGYRIRVEERVLAAELGDPYRAYMKRTKRLIPFLV